MLELVIGQIALGLGVVPLRDEVEERLTLLVVGERLPTTSQLTGAPSSIVVNEWPSRGLSGRMRLNAPSSSRPSGWRSRRR